MKTFILLLFTFFVQTGMAQENRPVLDIQLTQYKYPYEVKFHNFTSQQQALQMAYMDVHSEHPNGKTIVLLHGKNFNGAYFKTTIESLSKQGYRVFVPDQIGFGKSSKPIGYQFSFQQLAANTMQILDSLQIKTFSVLGHSMGGMLATRLTLMYPDRIEKLVLENPIGLEDWKRVAAYTTIDQHFQNELQANYATTQKYQLGSYYDNQWKPEYDEWVYLLTGWIKHPDYPIVAMNNAQTAEMIFTQPVLYEFENIRVPTLLIIGTRDRTAIGKNTVKDSATRAQMGQYQSLGKQTQAKIPGSIIVELDDVGHLPHIEVFERFIIPLQNFLQKK